MQKGIRSRRLCGTGALARETPQHSKPQLLIRSLGRAGASDWSCTMMLRSSQLFAGEALALPIILTLAAKSGIGVQFLLFRSQKADRRVWTQKFNGEVFLRPET